MKPVCSIIGEFHTLPNYITVFRLVLLPGMWALFHAGFIFFVGIGVVIAALTDVLDGYIARKCKQTTTIGSILDTVADNLLILSSCFWLFSLEPALFHNNIRLFVSGIVVYGLSILVCVIRFKRFPYLHLYSSKISAGVCYFVFVLVFSFDIVNNYLFAAALWLLILSNSEILAFLLIEPHYPDNAGSVFF